MAQERKVEVKLEAGRLLPSLTGVPYVEEPPGIDRFEVRILPNGHIYFKGSHERIEEFLQACAAEGLEVTVDHIALCG